MLKGDELGRAATDTIKEFAKQCGCENAVELQLALRALVKKSAQAIDKYNGSNVGVLVLEQVADSMRRKKS